MARRKQSNLGSEHFTKMVRTTMETTAWRSLSTAAQSLYVWLKLEWHGSSFNNNGKIRLSVRQAAFKIGISINTAARAFHELQAKGFIVVTKHARLGIKGQATSPTFELTELALPHGASTTGRRLYQEWKPDADYPVHKAAVHNPNGRQGKRNPVIKLVTSRHQNRDA